MTAILLNGFLVALIVLIIISLIGNFVDSRKRNIKIEKGR